MITRNIYTFFKSKINIFYKYTLFYKFVNTLSFEILYISVYICYFFFSRKSLLYIYWY